MPVDFDALIAPAAQAAFGTPCTWSRTGLAPVALVGIWDRHGGSLSFDSGGAGISTREVRLGVRLADFPAGVTPMQNDRVTIAGNTWTVQDVTPDGLGSAKLTLSGRSAGSDLP